MYGMLGECVFGTDVGIALSGNEANSNKVNNTVAYLDWVCSPLKSLNIPRFPPDEVARLTYRVVAEFTPTIYAVLRSQNNFRIHETI